MTRDKVVQALLKDHRLDQGTALRAVREAERTGSAAIPELGNRRLFFLDAGGWELSGPQGDIGALAEARWQALALECRAAYPAAEATGDGSGWVALLPGTPVTGSGETRDDALASLVPALRDYAMQWRQRLRHVPDHARHELLARLADASDDAQLRAWLAGQ